METDFDYEDIDREMRTISMLNLKKLEDLMKAGADVNSVLGLGMDEDTLLHFSFAPNVVKLLLVYGANVHLRNVNEETPLHTAIIRSKVVPVIFLLLEFGSDVNAVDKHGRTPLYYSVDSPRPPEERLVIWKELLAYGAEINTGCLYDIPMRHYCTPLCKSIGNDDEFSSKYFLRMSLIINFLQHCTKPFDFKKFTEICKRDSRLLNILTVYQDQCICEIVKMKSHKLYTNCSLFHLITISKSAFIKPLYPNHNIKRKKILKSFPIYNDVILPSLKLSRKRGRILNELKKIELWRKEFYNTSSRSIEKNILVSLDCLLLIATYLTNDDIKNFLRAFNKNSNTCQSALHDSEIYLEVFFSHHIKNC